MELLITAGATRNPIDAVRYLSAYSTGKTGVTLARGFAARGAKVSFLGSAEACLRLAEDDPACFTSTEDLLAQMKDWVERHPRGAVIHAAAVGDYEMAAQLSQKIPSGSDELVLRLKATAKILDRVRGWGLVGPLVSFKAASPDVDERALVALANAQRDRTGSDWVFANVLGRLQTRVLLMGEEPVFFERRADGLAALIRQVVSKVVC